MKLCNDYCVVACINCIHFEFHDYDDFDGYCSHPEGEYDFKLYEHCCDDFVCIHYKDDKPRGLTKEEAKQYEDSDLFNNIGIKLYNIEE